MRYFFSLFIMLACLSTLAAQPKLSWKKRAKMADDYYAQGAFNQAAEYYKSAFLDQPKELSLTFKAAECYYNIHDYENAAKAYEPVKDKNKEFDKPGFKYAQCLKQQGIYDQALKEFQAFGLTYNGDDYKTFEAIVKMEMDGCNFAIDYDRKKEAAKVEIEHLDSKINSDRADFAPIPIQLDEDEVLYFSSQAEGSAKIYRAVKSLDEGWSDKSVPTIFKNMENVQYGNGTFTPNGNRFYFTQCEVLATGKSRCDLFLMEKGDEGGFGAPVKLPDFINGPTTTCTHPNVYITDDNREVLLFSSDRPGGRGGLDLWFVTKSSESTGVNFTLPVNMGNVVNTALDEVTPFYDVTDQTLYYSSNGIAGFGGLDVFKTTGNMTRWSKPVNLGKPLNSPADDLYYTLKEFRDGGYFVSNRKSEPAKTSTTDDDIFYFGKKDPFAQLKGKILDAENEDNTLSDVKMTLSEIKNGDTLFRKEYVFLDGKYNFSLEAGRIFIIKATRSDYKVATIEVSTEDVSHPEEIEQNITLEKIPLTERIVPRTASFARPYLVPTVPPLNPVTREPYDEFSDEFKKWTEIAQIASKSKSGEVYYDDAGTILPANPIEEEEEPVAVADPPKGSKKSTKKDTGKNGATVKDKTDAGVAKTDKTSKTDKAVAKTDKAAKTEKAPETGDPEMASTNTDPETQGSTPEETPEVKEEKQPKSSKTSKSKAVTAETFVPVGDNPLAQVVPGSEEEARTEEGVDYRVQISAVREYKESKYAKASKYGEVDASEVSPDGYTRVNVGKYPSIREAREAVAGLKKQGFKEAFINRYEGGVRIGEGFQ